MRTRTILMIPVLAGLCLTGCGRGVPEPQASADAVEVRLETVEARQYRRAELRVWVSAMQVRFDEDGDWLEASGAVRAELSPALWQEEQP